MKRRQSHTQPVEPLMLTIPQVATMLGLGRTKVYDLIAREGLPTARFGTATRVPVKQLEKCLAQRIA